MNQFSTIWSPLFFTILELSVFIAFLFFSLSPMKTKNLKKFTILTGLFVLYNVLNYSQIVWGASLPFTRILYLSSLLILLFFTTYSVASIFQKQYNRGFKVIMGYVLLTPLVTVAISFFQSGDLIENVIANFFFSFPLILSQLITLLFYFHRGLQKKHQLQGVLISSLVLMGSITNFFNHQADSIINIHFILINVNFLTLTIFTVITHRRSIILQLYKGKRKSNIDPSLSEHLKSYHLTHRQIEIAQHILDGKSYNEIAENCHLALNTVTKHASNIFKKVGVCDKESFIKKIT